MQAAARDGFLPMRGPGGDLSINVSLGEGRQVTGNDVRLLPVPAGALARDRIGRRQMAAMVALGG